MNDPSFASLSPNLLARKGGAKPAMRPQHGGMLGSIGSETKTGSSPSDETLDDLGWNDMGDEDPSPHSDADIVKLTPSPINDETAAETRQMDEQTGATLAGFTGSSSPARDQQEVLARRIEKKSPPILSDAIMSDENELGTSDDDYDNDGEYEAEFDVGLEDGDFEEEDDNFDGAVLELNELDQFSEDGGTLEILKPGKASVIFPEITAVETSRPARAHRVPAVDQGKRAAFTLRLDAERHLKLRLASTIGGLSAQQIVTDALDAFLSDMPELATLAAQVKRPDADNS